MDFRSEFFEFDDVSYLNAAGQGPLPRTSARAAQEALEWKKLPHRLADELHFTLPDRVRATVAKLIHADPEDIAITTGASGVLAAVACGMEWKPGDEVLVGAGEFPAHFSTWIPYEKAGRLKVRVVEPRERFISAEDYMAEIGPRTRLISASLVRYDNASRLDSPQLAEACHAAGAALLIDASQGCGAIPLDVPALGADFVVCAGYKWLLSPYGTGFFWLKREWSERLGLGPLYWMALEGARDFSGLPFGKLRAVPGARRWDSPETANFINLSAMAASLEFLLRAGPEKIEAHNARLLGQLQERLPRDRCVLASPADPAHRGPYLCVAARKPEKTRELYDRLVKEKVVVSLRGGGLRVSPHLYNTEHDIGRLITVLSV